LKEKGKLYKDVTSTVQKMEKAWEKHTKSMGGLQSAYVNLAAKVYLLGKAYRVAMNFEGMIAGWMKLSGAQSIAEQQLKQAMVTSNRFSQSFYDDTLKMAKSIQQLTGIGDEFIIQGQKALLSFTRIPEELVPRVTKAMVDLSAFTGRTMEQSARIFGKASLGMTGELRRLAIPIDKTIFALKGFEGVLEQVEHHVQDQVMAIREGYGAWKAYADQMKEAKERMGDFFNAIMVKTGVLEALITNIKGINAAFDEFKKSGRMDEWAKKTATGVIDSAIGMITAFEMVVSFVDEVFIPTVKKIGPVFDEIMDKFPVAKTVDRFVDWLKEAAEHNKEWERLVKERKNYSDYLSDAFEHGPLAPLTPTTPKTLLEKIIGSPEENEKVTNKFIKKLEAIKQSFISLQDDIAYNINRDPRTNILPNLLGALMYGSESFGAQTQIIEAATPKHPRAPSEQFVALEEEVQKKIRKQVLGTTEFKIDQLMRWYETTKETYMHEQQDFAHLTNYKDMMLAKYNSEYLEAQETLAKETMEIWHSVADGITDTLGDAFADLLMGQEEAWKKLGKSISRIFADTAADIAKKKFISPMVNQMVGGMMGNLYSPNFMGPLPEGAVRGSAMMPYVGAGAMGYGMGDVGGAVGSMGGMALGSSIAALGSFGGPIGMIAGGLLGGLFGGDDGPNFKEIIYAQQSEQQSQLLTIANEAWFSMLEDFMQDFSSSMGSSISNGFLEAYQSQEYQTFINAFKSDMGGSVVEAFTKIMATDALKPLMNLFEPAFSKVSEYTQPDKVLALGFEQYKTDELKKAQDIVTLGDKVKDATYPLWGWTRSTGGKYPTLEEYYTAQNRVANLTNPSAAISYGGRTYTGNQWSELATSGGLEISDIVKAFPANEDLTAYLAEMEPVFDKVTDALNTVTDSLGLTVDALGENTAAILGPVESFLRELTVGQYAPAVSLEGIQAEYQKLYESAYFDPDAFSEFASFAKSGYLDYMKAYGGYDPSVAGVISDTQAMPWVQEAQEKQAQEQQEIYVNNQVTVTSHIYLDGHELGQAIAEVIETNEDVQGAIQSAVGN